MSFVWSGNTLMEHHKKAIVLCQKLLMKPKVPRHQDSLTCRSSVVIWSTGEVTCITGDSQIHILLITIYQAALLLNADWPVSSSAQSLITSVSACGGSLKRHTSSDIRWHDEHRSSKKHFWEIRQVYHNPAAHRKHTDSRFQAGTLPDGTASPSHVLHHFLQVKKGFVIYMGMLLPLHVWERKLLPNL